MNKHPYFNILLPSNAELVQALGKEISERQPLHEWPLSCVELLTCHDQSRTICKSISGPIIEPLFYQAVDSPLLPTYQVLHQDNRYAISLIEFLDGLRADELTLEPSQACQLAWELTDQIRKLPSNAPTFMEIGSKQRWQQCSADMCHSLTGLIAQGEFTAVTQEAIESLRQICGAPSIVDAVTSEVGLIHADLSAQNVFCVNGHYRIIDWQFPRIGPRAVDIALFLDSLAFDPLEFIEKEYVAIMHLIRIEWLVQCASRWFPDGRKVYDSSIASMIKKLQQ